MLHDLSWHGRRFTVAIGPQSSSVTLNSGAALPLKTGDRIRRINTGRILTLRTRRPDLAVTDDVALCGRASATSSQPGAPALAAVDGSPVTDWQSVKLPSTLILSLRGGTQTMSTATLRWGQTWPSAPGTQPSTSPRSGGHAQG